MVRVVGIDLGTTKSVVCVLENGSPLIIASAEGARATPSVVGFAKDGEVLAGQPAKGQAVTNVDRTFRSVRRHMGTDWTTEVDGRNYTSQEITARVLMKLKRDAEAYLGEEISDAVITAPACFSEAERQAIKQACVLAGLAVIQVVGGTSLVGLAYAVKAGAGTRSKIVVFDLGGGTLDVSLLEIGEGVVEVRATSGDNHLGGDDWDERIVTWLVDKFKAANGIDLTEDRMALQRIREAAEKAKIELSSSTSATINLPYISVDADRNPLLLDEQLSRAEFQKITSDLLERTRQPFTNVIRDAGIAVGDIDHVVLVGGSTRMPAVSDLVKELTGGREPNKGVNPDEVVAVGAALQAGVRKGEVKDVLLMDVTPISVGIETKGGVFTKLIERNTTIPARRSEIFTTTEDNQTSVRITVFQGEHETAVANRQLGVLCLTELSPAPKGTPQIEVTIDVNQNTVHATVQDVGTGAEQSMTITGDAALAEDRVVGEVERRGDNGVPSPAPRHVAGLGEHRATYLPWFSGKGAIRGLLAVSAGCAVLVVIGIVAGIRNLSWISGVVGVLCGIGYLHSISSNKKTAGMRLELFEHGLVSVSSGGQSLSLRWDSMTVYQSIVRRIVNGAASTFYTYTLYGPDGTTVRLRSEELQMAETWGPAIQNAVTAAQLPTAIATLERGGTLTFGDISLNVDSVTANGETRRWWEVKKVDVSDGHVVIRVQDKWLALSHTAVSQIPNFVVFYELAERLRVSGART
nr:Chaperone protein DnaK [Kibdelosporangium sp. MJ126-NF4]CTQ98838.1 Chaperone protein DnaK [Kibdelosporangium sp. MJ126-NF4]